MYGRTWIHVINYRFVSGNYVVLFVIEFDDVRNYGLVGDTPRTSTNGLSLSLSLYFAPMNSLCVPLLLLNNLAIGAKGDVGADLTPITRMN